MQIEKLQDGLYAYELAISGMQEKFSYPNLKRVLDVDEELNDEVQREILVENDKFLLRYKSSDVKKLRIAISKQLTRISTALEAMDLFSQLE